MYKRLLKYRESINILILLPRNSTEKSFNFVGFKCRGFTTLDMFVDT